MIAILATSRRPANRKRRPREPLGARFSRIWQAATPSAPSHDPESDEIPAPRVMGARILAGLAAVICVGLLASLVGSLDQYRLRTRQFQVRDFEVRGNHRLTDAEIVDATGVRSGNGLLRLEPAAIRGRLEELAWIRRARGPKELPARLVVEVEEFVPVAVVVDRDLVLVDDAGHLIAEATRGRHDELPYLTGLHIADLRREPPDTATLLARRRLKRLLALVGSWDRSDLFALGEINWDAARGITLVSATDGAEIRIGHTGSGDIERRFAQIRRLLTAVNDRKERLRYALLDDDVQPNRGVVRTADKGEWAGLPPLSRAPQRPAGPAERRPPAASPGDDEGGDRTKNASNKRRRRARRARPNATEHGGI